MTGDERKEKSRLQYRARRARLMGFASWGDYLANYQSKRPPKLSDEERKARKRERNHHRTAIRNGYQNYGAYLFAKNLEAQNRRAAKEKSEPESLPPRKPWEIADITEQEYREWLENLANLTEEQDEQKI